MKALGINGGYILMQLLLFGVLFLVLKNYAWTPILNMLDERKKRIAKGLEDARQAAIARDNADAEAKKILDEARAESARIRSAAAGQAEKQANEILAKANEDAKDVLAKARADAELERNAVLSGLRGQVSSISMAAANKLIGEALNADRQRSLINGFLSDVPAGVSALSGGSAEITSALPLTESEQAKASKAVNASDVSFKVDPSILGGLIVRVGDQIVDDSVAGRMTTMRESLN